MFALPPSLLYLASLLYPVSSMPILHFLLPDAFAAMHMPFMLLSECLMAVAPTQSQPSSRQQQGVSSGALPLVIPASPPASRTGVCPSEQGHTMAEVIVVIGHLLTSQHLPWARDMLAGRHCCLGSPDRTPGHRPRPRDVAVGHLLDGQHLPWVRNMLAGGHCCLGGPDQTLGHRPRSPDRHTVMALPCLLWLECCNRCHVIDAKAVVVVHLVRPS
jgi:hypothetical protein